MSARVISDKVYLIVFGGLLVLTLTTYEAAKLKLGHWNTPLGLGIGGIKAALVALYFMHARYSSRLIRVVIGAGVFWLAIMLTLTMSDYLTR